MIGLVVCVSVLSACGPVASERKAHPMDWSLRAVAPAWPDTLPHGKTYLSVYAQIYSLTEAKRHDLTATISVRNVSERDTVFLHAADFYRTDGDLVRAYLSGTVFVLPMETLEFVIEEADRSGGTGANFLFEWSAPATAPEPLFEGVMISTSGQQGLSFTTRGVRVG